MASFENFGGKIMDKFLNKMEESLVPIAFKLDSNRYLSAIKSGFFGITSILIVGAMFLLLSSLPIEGYPEFMAGLMGENWQSFFLVPNDMTLNMMNVFVMMGMSRSLARYYKVDDLGPMILTLVAFFIMTPLVVSEEGASALPMADLGSTGVFLGMITAIVVSEIYRWIIQQGWVIKFPESVPSNVSTAFSALFPAFVVILFFNLIRVGFGMTDFGTANNFIFKVLQTPLLSMGRSLPAILFTIFLETLLWSFGIHGANVVGSVMNPIYLSLTAENAAAYAAGTALPNIINAQWRSLYAVLGGSGSTFGLVLAMLFFAKSTQYKTLGKLALGPGIFNINEPVVFGIPIVLNPIMIIPFILVPQISAALTYFVMAIGLVPYTNGVNLPWTIPPVIGGLLASGWQGAVWQVILIFVQLAVYFPFFRIVDNQAYALEIDDPSILEGVDQDDLDEVAETQSN